MDMHIKIYFKHFSINEPIKLHTPTNQPAQNAIKISFCFQLHALPMRMPAFNWNRKSCVVASDAFCSPQLLKILNRNTKSSSDRKAQQP